MKISKLIVFTILFATSKLFCLEPLMLQKGKMVYESEFNETGDLDKNIWNKRQNTRWEVKNGVLVGIESTKENQAAKDHHKGTEPRINLKNTPENFIIEFEIVFKEGVETPLTPFVEFGHHYARVRFRESGIDLIGDHESVILSQSSSKRSDGKVYHCLAERMGDQFIMQIKDGPTLYGQHSNFSKIPKGVAFGVAGTRGGLIELDNVKVWTAKGFQSSWETRKSDYITMEPLKLVKPVKKKKKN